MEIKLKKKFLPNTALPVKKHEEVQKGTTAITTRNIAGISLQAVAYEHSREYLVHIAEVEIQRSIALAEAHRLQMR